MRRREFIALFGSAVMALRLVARAQQTELKNSRDSPLLFQGK